MDDLVKRLRSRDADDMMHFAPDTLCAEAANRIEQLERDLAEVRENNVGEFESRSESQRKVRTLKAQVIGLERELADFKASQHYRYIGVDGKPVLARELEDRAIKAERELAERVEQVGRISEEWAIADTHLESAQKELAAEKARADTLPDLALSVVAYELSCAGYDDAYSYASGKYVKRMVEDQCRRKERGL